MTVTNPASLVRETTDNTFTEDVLHSDTPVLVEFTAHWCPPCRMIAPVLDQIATDESARLRIVTLDVDHNSATALKYEVMGMPTFALFVEGTPVTRFTGARPRTAILREIEPHLPPNS